MAIRKRNRIHRRSSILERYAQQRMQTIRATTGCDLYLIERNSPPLPASQLMPVQLAVIDRNSSLTDWEVAKLAQQARLLRIVENQDIDLQELWLGSHLRYDATLYLADEEPLPEGVLPSLLRSFAQQHSSLMEIQFAGWGAAELIREQVRSQEWQNLATEFHQMLDLEPIVLTQHKQLLDLLKTCLSPGASAGRMELCADGCRAILKIRCPLPGRLDLLSKLLDIPALALAFSKTETELEIVAIHSQQNRSSDATCPKVILDFSPRRLAIRQPLDEVS